ncbi:MAG TPA: SDR family oxidoreductase, partial [Polyangiaceae bacterium]|nr:SDR family oxidoreductase [Polyangiaceae bacterium]
AAAGAPVSRAALVAGGWAGGAPVHEGARELGEMLDLNTLTVHSALAGLLPGMVARRAGAVVVVGSRNVERPWAGAGSAAYTASKAAAVALAEAVAAEVLSAGVRINSVLVSTMDTPANREGMPDADPTRWVSTESAAGVIAFLLSDEARDISGASVPVYGRA